MKFLKEPVPDTFFEGIVHQRVKFAEGEGEVETVSGFGLLKGGFEEDVREQEDGGLVSEVLFAVGVEEERRGFGWEGGGQEEDAGRVKEREVGGGLGCLEEVPETGCGGGDELETHEDGEIY